MMMAIIELFCDSFVQAPRRLGLYIDDTDDRASASLRRTCTSMINYAGMRTI
jgi:hypothetical protein